MAHKMSNNKSNVKLVNVSKKVNLPIMQDIRSNEELQALSRQCELVSNMAFSCADTLDSLILEMTRIMKTIHYTMPYEERGYWTQIQRGLNGLHRIVKQCASAEVQDRLDKDADINAVVYKLMNNTISSDIQHYKVYLLLKSLPPVFGYKQSENEERMAFYQVPSTFKSAVESEVEEMLEAHKQHLKNRAKKMKTAVLVLSKEFQYGHSKAGQQTLFVDKVANGEKLHTIRGRYEYWQKKAEQINAGTAELSLRIWLGRPYHSPMYEVAKLKQLKVQRFDAKKDAEGQWHWYVDGKEQPAEVLAQNDGLQVEDWQEWMLQGNKRTGIEGAALLQFTDFVYE